MGVGMKLRKDSPADDGVPEGPSPAAVRREAVGARTQLGELLVGAKLVTHDQLAQALMQQVTSGQRIGTLLVELGAIDERDLAKALSTQLHVPLVDLSQQTPTPEAIELMPESVSRSHLAVPLVIDIDGLTVAVSDPNPELAKILANACGQVVRLVIAPRSDIQRAIDTAYRALGNIQEHVRAFEETDGEPSPRHGRHRRAGGHGRRRTGRPGRQPPHHPGHPRPGVGHPHRAPGERPAHPVPHRRRPARRRRAAAVDGPGPRESPEDHGQHEHRRAPPTPGRPDHDGRRRPRDRHPGVDGGDDLGRELRPAGPRQEPVRSSAWATSACPPTPTRSSPVSSGPRSGWCCAPAPPAAARRRPSTRR